MLRGGGLVGFFALVARVMRGRGGRLARPAAVAGPAFLSSFFAAGRAVSAGASLAGRAVFAAAAAAALLPQAAGAEGFKLLSLSTLAGQLITFAVLVWVVMKFVWPPLMRAIEERQKEIADGLAAGERGRAELQSAEEEKAKILAEAREKFSGLVAEGEKRRGEIVEAAKAEGESERGRIVEEGRREVEAERVAMHRHFEQKVGELVVAGAEKIVQREVDAAAHADIIDGVKKSL